MSYSDEVPAIEILSPAQIAPIRKKIADHKVEKAARVQAGMGRLAAAYKAGTTSAERSEKLAEVIRQLGAEHSSRTHTLTLSTPASEEPAASPKMVTPGESTSRSPEESSTEAVS